MSTRFEKKIIMPKGAMGITTLMNLSDEDIKSVERWHIKEWNEFRTEIVAYKHKILNAARDTYLWNREKCVACKKIREFKSKRRQRGSIMLGGAVTSVAGPGSDPGDCTYTTSTIPNLSDFDFDPGDAYTRARLHSDGNWYENEGAASWGTSDGTWQGGCAVADYDTQWNLVSGDTSNNVTSGSDGVWSAATTSKAVGYAVSFGSRFGNFSLVCRDGTTLTTLFTDTFSMSADVEF